ncbi:MAG: acetate uptake transporter [Streptosporangiaceae bacterium]|jgi:succinate-acetate transporter protein
MATTDLERPLAQPVATPAVPASGWGNAAPLGLAGFAVTTFMLSMINAKLVNAGVEPVVFGVALMFGGIAQLIAGTIQFRLGSTFTGVLFTSFGAFWLSLWAIAEFFLKDVPPAQVGHALGLFLYAFGIFTAWLWLASFRTNALVVLSLGLLAATLFVLGVGNYSGSALTIETGGYMGLAVAFLAAYLSCAELCEASYKRSVLPLWPLAKH